jgi:hypothetical protein
MTTPYPLTRGYDRGFDWIYGPDASVVPPATPGLISVYWDGLPLNTGDQDSGLCSVVENVEGWLDSPPLNGHDTDLVLADGAGWGVKTLGPRTITLTGAAEGPRDQLGRLRDQLAVRAAARQPADLTITDAGALDRALTASVRSGTDPFKLTWLSRYAFRWSAVVTAADPALYDAQWQQAILSNGPGGATGRPYQRVYAWQYAASYLPNSQLLVNDGNWPAPVFALYGGDLAASQMSDDQGGIINLAAIATGQQILVYTATLAAVAAGGLSRASYIQPGSVPMVVNAGSTARWHLYGAGYGQVTLAWRSAWV